MTHQFERRAANRDPDDAVSPEILAVLATRSQSSAGPLASRPTRWAGACPAGRKPGDIRMPNGAVMNLN